MKFKEILTNKWGWVTAGIVLTLVILVYFIHLSQLTFLGNIFNSIINFIGNFFPNSGGERFGQMFFIELVILPIMGFIIGLILQKLWRKLK